MIVWEMTKSEIPSGLLIDWSDTTLINGVFSTNYIAKAELHRQGLLNSARSIVADWRTELQLDVINEEDKAHLVKWMAYIKALKALNLSSLEDEADYNAINWPPLPSS